MVVLTRSQKTKEENDTALAKQQSLAEQSQQASVSQQLQHELQGAAISQQDVAQQDVIQQGVVQQDVFDEVSGKPDVKRSSSESSIVENLGDESLLSIKDVQDNVKAEAKESSSIKTETEDSKQKPAITKLASKTVGTLPIREKEIVSDNVEPDVPVNERSVRAKDRKAPGKPKS
jgi:hypothetical protein